MPRPPGRRRCRARPMSPTTTLAGVCVASNTMRWSLEPMPPLVFRVTSPWCRSRGSVAAGGNDAAGARRQADAAGAGGQGVPLASSSTMVPGPVGDWRATTLAPGGGRRRR